ncbi:HXXEE domain-containing protein [Plantibacter sp. CFBP 8798]|uniref:HXXEE domain-containing protein n=1 Tax=Plantibacter sp. CFBP 8798 TaxID=2775268 RepID=UPI00177C8078|nr:HXXEE domain-containing protein [Plantibacter sp. CFBP 8798]
MTRTGTGAGTERVVSSRGLRKGGRFRGPVWLFVAWVLHDIEEGAAFPATCDLLADRTGIRAFRMDARQSWLAVGLMGCLVGFACIRGVRTAGSSPLYRAVVAGLGAHTGSHVLASLLTQGYTAGVVSALPVMLPGAIVAERELARRGLPITARDRAMGALVLLPSAFVCHLIARVVVKRRLRAR